MHDLCSDVTSIAIFCLINLKEDCIDIGCIYEIACNSCQHPVDPETSTKDSIYSGGQTRDNFVGRTATRTHYRMQRHLSGQKQREQVTQFTDIIWRHNGEPQNYSTKIIRNERTLLPLSVTEKKRTGTRPSQSELWPSNLPYIGPTFFGLIRAEIQNFSLSIWNILLT